MTVAGFNVDPESVGPVCGVEMNDNEYQNDKQGRPTAALYIDFGLTQQEITLSYEEVYALHEQLMGVRNEMQWKMATWVQAQAIYGQAWHLQTKGCHGEQVTAICGQAPPSWGWRWSPLMSDIEKSGCCKRCLVAARKRAA